MDPAELTPAAGPESNTPVDKIYSTTLALCPACRSKVPAHLIERDGRVYLEKFCPLHGVSYALTCSDAGWYRAGSHYLKPGQKPLSLSVAEFEGCPDSCGLCPQHQQHSCMPIVEVTHACDLECPICLKRLNREFLMSPREFAACLAQVRRCEGELGVINLSGGEPTTHPRFAELLKIAADCGVLQTTVSTNGLRLLADPGLRKAFREYDVLAAVQFDGFKPETYRQLRGADLAAQKLRLIELLEAEGVRYSLVSTVLRNVNEDEIAPLVDFFFRSKAHSLMLQPATFTGNGVQFTSAMDRLTIPDVVKEIEKSRYVVPGDFNPLPCSHHSCFALAYYFVAGERQFLSLKKFFGEEDYLKIIANRTLPGLDADSYTLMKEKIYEFWSAADTSLPQEKVLEKIRSLMKELNTGFSPQKAFRLGANSMKAIYIHQFMDVHTFDFGRAVKCCNHYPHADGKLIPMCVENVLLGKC